MNGKVHYTACPVCGSTGILPLLTVPDHSVSGEAYVVWQCADCTLRFTQDAPDADSIGKYYQSDAYISHTDSREGLMNRLYQRVRRITLESKAALIKSFTKKPQGRLLDVGAGTGAFLHAMQQKGWQATGMEPDAGARKVAAERYGLQILEPSALQELPAGSQDAITLWHVLEHVHALHPYMQRLKELLSDGGRLFIAVPNYRAAEAGVYGPAWAAYDVPRHLYHFSPRSLEVLSARHGLQIEARKPMWFDSYYISLLSSKYRTGKTSWPGAFIQGSISNARALLDRDRASSIIYIIRKK